MDLSASTTCQLVTPSASAMRYRVSVSPALFGVGGGHLALADDEIRSLHKGISGRVQLAHLRAGAGHTNAVDDFRAAGRGTRHG